MIALQRDRLPTSLTTSGSTIRSSHHSGGDCGSCGCGGLQALRKRLVCRPFALLARSLRHCAHDSNSRTRTGPVPPRAGP